ncbi:hypothetical protein ACTNBM_07080 [Lachnospiraceae bacterium HCP1S3_C3]|nr:hypothetical protein [Lachnospiraceae bacterium]MDD6857394.1 hypothetical protein [Lachnospiraceae bacterium]
MVKSFVQILNIGFGIINNTEPVADRNPDSVMEHILSMDDPARDIRIIGFRFYDMDTDTGVMSNQSGIYYLEGEEFTYPKVDNDITTYMKTTNIEYEKGQQLIKIKKPNVLVYPFNANDTILDTAAVLVKMKIKKEEERKARLEEEIIAYKNNLVLELRKVQELLEGNQFNAIPLVDTMDGAAKALNIMGDKGNFNKHINHMRNIRVEIMAIDKFLRENAM